MSTALPAAAVLRFWSHTRRHENGCLQWTAYIDRSGYGLGQIKGISTRAAHRIAWILTNGPVPDGLQLDHLCRNRWCVEVTHLEPVTPKENVRRGLNGVLLTHCPQGHPYDEANTYRGRGERQCRICRRDAKLRFDQRQKEMAR